MEIEELTFHYPCLVGSGVGLKQLESRLQAGFIPSLIIRKHLSADEIKQLEPQLHGEVSFDIGACPPPSIEACPKFISYIGKLADEYGFKPEICYKFGLAGKPGQFDLQSYQKAYEKHLKVIQQHRELAASHGATILLENDPRPDYTFGDKLPNPDPYPRWQGKWSAAPCFNGTMLADAADIKKIIGNVKDSKLQLDMEHLGQTVQWGNIFSLESAPDRILKFKDLDAERRVVLESYRMHFNETDTVFDYKTMSTDEQRFLDEFGYVFRAGQPLVYQNKLTLKKQLNDVLEIPISSITPGFQVYQGVFDVIDGKRTVVIGSHLPGITKHYVKNVSMRAILKEKLKSTHRMVWQFMENKNIKDVEIEAHVDDGTNLVYDGPAWSIQANEARSQLLENFKLAKNGSRFCTEPYYLK
jgi:hypothetical protein